MSRIIKISGPPLSRGGGVIRWGIIPAAAVTVIVLACAVSKAILKRSAPLDEERPADSIKPTVKATKIPARNAERDKMTDKTALRECLGPNAVRLKTIKTAPTKRIRMP